MKLDNPVWHSLSEAHEQFAIDCEGIKFYHPDYCPFGGFINMQNTIAGIDQYALLCDNFYIVGDRPKFSASFELKNELVCNQMIVNNRIETLINEEVVKLNEGHANELFQLVNLVQPGYFKSKTRLLGNYYGIFKDNNLIAVTGERMRMNDHVEVSAVVTHPGHTGKGYAQQLIAHTVNTIFDDGHLTYLHVAESNHRAISLYEKLGFRTRRKMSFWNLIRN